MCACDRPEKEPSPQSELLRLTVEGIARHAGELRAGLEAALAAGDATPAATLVVGEGRDDACVVCTRENALEGMRLAGEGIYTPEEFELVRTAAPGVLSVVVTGQVAGVVPIMFAQARGGSA